LGKEAVDLENSELEARALAKYDAKQYSEALSLYRKLSKMGSKVAWHHLGLMYFYGYGEKQNYERAYECFEKAAVELYPEAIYMMGYCYEEGLGVMKNLQKAYDYYVTAAHKDVADALLAEARFFEEGKIVQKSKARALEIYVELAKKDNPFAMYKIGLAYFDGDGVRKSLESAYSWFNKALSKGSIDAMNQFRLIGTKSVSDIRETKTLYTAAKEYYMSDNPEKSIIYFEITAREGITEGYRYLAEAYEKGKGVEKSSKKSYGYLLKAADAGDVTAMIMLGHRNENGDGVPSSYIKAGEWYEKAAKLGSEEAKSELFGLRGY